MGQPGRFAANMRSSRRLRVGSLAGMMANWCWPRERVGSGESREWNVESPTAVGHETRKVACFWEAESHEAAATATARREKSRRTRPGVPRGEFRGFTGGGWRRGGRLARGDQTSSSLSPSAVWPRSLDSMKTSISPSMTEEMLPVLQPVRWSLTS